MKKLHKHVYQKVKSYKKVSVGKQRQPVPVLTLALLFGVVGTYLLMRSLAATGNDLVVTSVTLTPASPSAGQQVTFSATVKNQGSTAISSGTLVDVAFYVDGTKVSWNQSNSAGLAAGASVTLTANAGTAGSTWTASAGPHVIVAKADDTNTIPDEVDEANNTLSKNITIGNTGVLYLTPTSNNVLINDNTTVNVRLTPGTNVDGVSATLTYDQTKLQFVSIDDTSSAFDIALGSQTGGSGTVTITRGTLSGGVSADSLVAKVTFKALAGSGSSTVTMSGNASKNGVYTNPTYGNSSFSFATPDTTAPNVSISSPSAGSKLYLTQTVTIAATDNVGVTKVELFVDGVLKGTDTSSPYAIALNSSQLANGNHSLVAKAYDAAGNVGTSSTVTVSVTNLAEDINQDGAVDLLDFSLLASKFGQSGSGLGRADINGDGAVDLLDFSRLASKFGS
ncbi:hypothetical protein KDA23_01585 [Candidatus Saccharibacteria bacterium]|nr:hypothetical protein [Candidatus Saccharibacteria bacterium]